MLLERLQATERRILAEGATPVDHGAYLVSRSTRYPKWYQVNHIELKEPGDRSLSDWESIYTSHFDPQTYGHLGLFLSKPERFAALIGEIDEARRTEAVTGQDRPLACDNTTYMFATHTRNCPSLPHDCEVLPVETEEDWEDLIRFAINEVREAPWFTNEADVRAYLESQRQIRAGIGVNWWRLCRKGHREILARLGIFDHEGISRLQSVGTAREHRRQGLASALVGHAIRIAIDERKSEGLALGADTGSHAQQMYAKLGFEPVGSDLWVFRYPAT